MSIDKVREYMKRFSRENDIMEFPVSSATVALAAEALNVIPARITKTLALKSGDSCIVIAVAGDGKIDNHKFKSEFGFRGDAGDDRTRHRRSMSLCPSGRSKDLLRCFAKKIRYRFSRLRKLQLGNRAYMRRALRVFRSGKVGRYLQRLGMITSYPEY